jgi:hypothetical protein
MAVNLTSVAATVFMEGAATVDATALLPEAGEPEETALCEPAFTVDFSTWVALDVRR